MSTATATKARERAIARFDTNLEIPRDVPLGLIEMPRGLGFTPEDFGFSTSPRMAVDEQEHDESLAREVEQAKFLFKLAMLELDRVTEYELSPKGRPIQGTGVTRSRWESEHVRVGPAQGKDAVENFWVEFVDTFWEEVLVSLEWVDPNYFDGRKGRMTQKEWHAARVENPRFQRHKEWLISAKKKYAHEAALAYALENVKTKSLLPTTPQELLDADYQQLLSWAKLGNFDTSGKTHVLRARLADKLDIEMPTKT